VALHDLAANRSIRTFAHGIPAPVMWLYARRYAHRNPIALTAGQLSEEGRVDTLATLFDDPETWFRSDTYRHIIRPVGARDVLSMVVLRSEARGVWLGAFRRKRDGDFTAEHARIFRMLAPHVVRSMRFADLLGMRAVEVERLAAALDMLSAAVWLVDGTARVLHANAAAEALLRRPAPPPLRLLQGRLVATAPEGNALLGAAIAEAAAEESAGFGVPPRPTIPLGGDGEGLIATVLRLGRGAPQGTTAAVFVQHPYAAPAAPIEAFGALHGLTPAEIRCLGEIALGRTVPEAAAALGIGPATARSHLNSIFAKTGASRQPELIRMLAAFAAPVRGPGETG
jgi:DNA-binding CsgD family transcriptional regulator/PAS domain-containing protein